MPGPMARLADVAAVVGQFEYRISTRCSHLTPVHCTAPIGSKRQSIVIDVSLPSVPDTLQPDHA